MPAEPSASITTLTLNPALDVSYEVPELIRDQKSRARDVRYDPGGNGINIARALKRLDLGCNAYGLLGGEVGLMVERLLRNELGDFQAVAIEDETRINCTLLVGDEPVQYEVAGSGPQVSPEIIARIGARFVQGCAAGFGVLTGSVPPGTPETLYGDLVERLRAQGARPVVDAHGAMLKHAIPQRPYLIKPNRFELEQYCGHALPTLQDVVAQARALQKDGIEMVCVSLGGQGAVLVTPRGSWHAQAPKVDVRSTVGAGDSMVAGMLGALARGDHPADALKLAIACGSGTAAMPGTSLFEPALVRELLPQVKVHSLDG